AQTREPAGPEVDRVQGEQVARDVCAGALEVVALGIEGGRRPGLHAVEGVEIDPDVACRGGDLLAVMADFVAETHRKLALSLPCGHHDRSRTPARGPERAPARGRSPRPGPAARARRGR